ncbi:hypothetical protein CFOL_v3_32717 [Cephalotus follicularis]|uniref:CCHC-type domain-containing protein n=1 Tax=Cephalotus follicularis TaxID=3775 RepID=A0A1Q3DA39_CEPFO|nr:hypothetical protein CFOL_v3_32717 [Cephalotus follicularis]
MPPPLPPLSKKQPGRPRTKRIRDPTEPPNPCNLKSKHNSYQCGKCGFEGHNRKTYPDGIPVPTRSSHKKVNYMGLKQSFSFKLISPNSIVTLYVCGIAKNRACDGVFGFIGCGYE